MADTSKTLYEIEIALSKSSFFDYIKNIVAFNVNGWGENLPLHHECDMLVLSKSGYLTEIEIKRSWSDFLADFKKKHKHGSENEDDKPGIIKNFYYAVPKSIADKVVNYIKSNSVDCNGVFSYDEGLNIRNELFIKRKNNFRKLSSDEMLQVARFGAMRSIKLKEKILKLKVYEDLWKETEKNNQRLI